MKNLFQSAIVLLTMLLLPASICSQTIKVNSDLKHWPKGSSPQEIGKRIAEHFVIRPLPVAPRKIPYPEVCTWYGALTFASLTGDNKLTTRLEERFNPLFGADSVLIPVPNHVDNSVFGSIPIELYILTKNQKYLKLGKRIADRQWAPPEGTDFAPEAKMFYDKGFTPQTRMWMESW